MTDKATDNKRHVLLPAKTCEFCDRTLHETGGQRLIAQQARGLSFSVDYPASERNTAFYRCLKLGALSGGYAVIRGESGYWTESAVLNVKGVFTAGLHSWFCQCCGKRLCRQCSLSMPDPVGSDVLSDNEETTYCSILPFPCGNPACKLNGLENYKERISDN